MGLLMLFKMNVRGQLKILMGETHNDPQETSYKLKENIINISLPACNVFRMRNNKLVKSICIYLHHVRKIKRKTNKVMRLNCQVTCLLIIYLYIYIYTCRNTILNILSWIVCSSQLLCSHSITSAVTGTLNYGLPVTH